MPRILDRTLNTYTVTVSYPPVDPRLFADASPAIRAVFAHIHGPVWVRAQKPRSAPVIGIAPTDRDPGRAAAAIMANIVAPVPTSPVGAALVQPGGLWAKRTAILDWHAHAPKHDDLRGCGALWAPTSDAGGIAFFAHELRLELWLQEAANGEVVAFAYALDFDLERPAFAVAVKEAPAWVAPEKPVVASVVPEDGESKGPVQGPTPRPRKGAKHVFGTPAQKLTDGGLEHAAPLSEPPIVELANVPTPEPVPEAVPDSDPDPHPGSAQTCWGGQAAGWTAGPKVSW